MLSRPGIDKLHSQSHAKACDKQQRSDSLSGETRPLLIHPVDSRQAEVKKKHSLHCTEPLWESSLLPPDSFAKLAQPGCKACSWQELPEHCSREESKCIHPKVCTVCCMAGDVIMPACPGKHQPMSSFYLQLIHKQNIRPILFIGNR